jgi:hypothetical protein
MRLVAVPDYLDDVFQRDIDEADLAVLRLPQVRLIGLGGVLDVVVQTRRDRDEMTFVIEAVVDQSTTFLQGSLSGQIKSVFKSRETNPQKVTDFKLGLANGDCTWDLRPLSKSLIAKLQTLGIEVPATAY